MVLKEKYELSVWNDIITNEKDGQVTDELKVAVIGFSGSTSPLHAYNVTVVENTNGEKTLSFQMPTKYNRGGDLIDNPLASMLGAERKLKLRVYTDEYAEGAEAEEDIAGAWTDYVIKNCDEPGKDYFANYQAKEVFVNELGKNGFNVTFATELENNYGTITQLTERTLEGSGWTLDPNSFSPVETTPEPLYIAVLEQPLSAYEIMSEELISIPIGETIYPTYSSVIYDKVAEQYVFKDIEEIQFLYKGPGLTFSRADTDDEGIIIDDNHVYNYGTAIKPDYIGSMLLTGTPNGGGDSLQGNAIVKGIVTSYDEINDRFVNEYEVINAASGAEVGSVAYKYTETIYNTSSVAVNHLTNTTGFVNNIGWLPTSPDPNAPMATCIPYDYPELITYDVHVDIVGTRAKFTLVDAADVVGQPGAIIINNKENITYSYTVDDYSLITANKLAFDIEGSNLGLYTTGVHSFTYTRYKTATETTGFLNCLEMPMSSDGATWRYYYNEGPSNEYNRIALELDKIYTVRLKGRIIKKLTRDFTDANGTAEIYTGTQPMIKVTAGIYAPQNGVMVFSAMTNPVYMNLSSTEIKGDGTYSERGYAIPQGDRVKYTGISADAEARVDSAHYAYAYFKSSATTVATTDRIHLEIVFEDSTVGANYNYFIDDIQFFDYAEDVDGVPIFLGDIPKSDVTYLNHYYYNDSNDQEIALSSDDSYYTPIYNEGFESVRHIEIKESNYFNIINTLAELFEVWVKFTIRHRNDGKILYDEITGQPLKQVRYSQYAPNGDDINYAGFKYGVNLTGIKRTTDGMALATKVIVKNNNQEYAVDGMCSIQRAPSNPSGENSIYNFGYYVNQGLIDYTQLLRDTYGLSSGDLGYFTQLKFLNEEYMSEANLKQKYEHEMAIAESYVEMYTEAVRTATTELENQMGILEGINPDDTQNYEAQLKTVELLQAQLESFEVLLHNYENALEQYTAMRDATQERIDLILEEKKALHEIFFKKYSRFVLEGSWVDDSYIDDELYYLDGVKVAQSSGFPQVNYSINVVEVNNIEGMSAYNFKIGERTYIEDTEFFGWTYVEDPAFGKVKTPYKMQVLVTQKTTNYDNPSASTIVIQNYKNQFEDMFQKMTNTTQTLIYESGGWKRAAGAVNPDGEFDVSGMEKAMANNKFQLASSTNQSVIWDSGKGIEVIDLNNTSLMTRIVAGGMYMTMDGGRTWINGINGQGINTHHLIAGQIDTSLIHLVANGSPIFRWDAQGISAFKYNGGLYDPDGELSNEYDTTQYVRFTQFGIFGTSTGLELQTALDDATNFDQQIEAIRNNSNFSLTWEGLYLKSQQGAVEIDPLDGMSVYDNVSGFDQAVLDSYQKVYHFDSTGAPVKYQAGELIPLVQMGKFVDDEMGTMISHGLRLRNKEGYVTLLTEEDGNLWLANILTVGQRQPIGEGAASFYKFLGIDGTIMDPTQASTTPVLYAGNPDKTLSPFRVFGDGRLEATSATIAGTINAESGHFSGDITVGTRAGINGTTILDETLGVETDAAAYTFWAGTSDVEGEQPTFFVTPDGHLTAKDAYFEGNGVFSGELVAASGSFAGWVDAYGGRFISRMTFGEEGTSYIGVDPDHIYPYININFNPRLLDGNPDIGAFAVESNGNVFADAIHLAKNGQWESDENPSKRYLMTMGGAGANIFNIYHPQTATPQETTVFAIKPNGEVFIGGTLETGGDLIFNGALKSADSGMIINGITGDITVKTPGIDGWGIYGNGDAYFGNVNVRGKISTVIFEQDKISSIGGKLLVSPSVITIEPMSYFLEEGNGIEMTYKYDIKSLVEIYGSIWRNVDRGIVNIYGEDIQNVLVEIDVTESGGDYTVNTAVITLTESQLKSVPEFTDPESGSLTTTTLPIGTQIISTSTKANAIALSVEDASGGTILITGPSDEDPDVQQTTLLGSLLDHLIPTSAHEMFGSDLGHGLFSDNAYLLGKLYTPNAGITNENYTYLKADMDLEEPPLPEDIEGREIRFWAGVPASTLANQLDEYGMPVTIPFVVTHNGTMYAKDGFFSGTIEATNSTFEGYLTAAGIVIDNPYPDNHFYVTRPREDGTDEFTPDDFIIDINENGLNIWEGGLNVFSDYYSGWRDNTKHGGQAAHEYYGWDGNMPYWPVSNSPWPILTVLDESELENHIPRISMTHSHVWFRDVNENIYSTKIHPSYIAFNGYALDDISRRDYKDIEQEAWNRASAMEVGHVRIAGETAYGIAGSKIVFGGESADALTIEPGESIENTVTTTKGVFNFGSVVQVSQESDGLTFTYIGEI